jgi:hypothetical protein
LACLWLCFLGLGVPYSPSFTPEEAERIWRQFFAIFLIGVSMVLCGGVILLKSRLRKRFDEG